MNHNDDIITTSIDTFYQSRMELQVTTGDVSHNWLEGGADSTGRYVRQTVTHLTAATRMTGDSTGVYFTAGIPHSSIASGVEVIGNELGCKSSSIWFLFWQSQLYQCFESFIH